MVQLLLQACHDDPMTGGHFSTDRIYYKVKTQYWWPGMRSAIKQHVRSCILCQQYNVSRQKRPGQLRPIKPPDGPLTFIGIDYCGPFRVTPRENQYVLVITDHFTRHVTAIALPNCTAETTAQTLFNEYFCKYGIPSVILSDQGSHFRNQLMDNIQKLIGYNHIYSTPYHPQTNGIVERFNSTFVPQISKLQDTQDNNWDEYLQAVVFAYNTGIHKTTRYSPYELLYGRPPRLPIDARPTHFTFNRPNDYFEQLKRTLRIYHQSAKHNIIQQQQMNKEWYDRNRLDPHYQIGDKVLTRIYGLRGKLDPKFSITPRIIIHAQHPIYIVEDETTQVQSQVHVGDLRPIILE
jgi:transposase InsO family protein